MVHGRQARWIVGQTGEQPQVAVFDQRTDKSEVWRE